MTPREEAEKMVCDHVPEAIVRSVFGKIGFFNDWIHEELIGDARLLLAECTVKYTPGVGSFRAYACQRMRWRVLDQLEVYGRRLHLSLEDDSITFTDVSAENLEEEITVRNLAESLSRKLTPTQQRIWALFCEDMSMRAIAKILDCTTANVSYHIRQIRQKLAETREAQSLLEG